MSEINNYKTTLNKTTLNKTTLNKTTLNKTTDTVGLRRVIGESYWWKLTESHRLTLLIEESVEIGF